MKKSANSYKRKYLECLKDRNNNDESALDEENEEILKRRIELYKHQIERKIENVSFK